MSSDAASPLHEELSPIMPSQPTGFLQSAEGSASSHSNQGTEPQHASPLPMKQVFFDFIAYAKQLGVLQILWVALLSIFVIVGQGMQLIFLNYWLREYPADHPPDNYTTFFISSLFFPVVFIIWTIGYIIVKRPKHYGFIWNMRGCIIILLIGTMDTVNSILAIYSADRASEIVEAVFSSLSPPLTAIVTRFLLNEKRNPKNKWFLIAMILSIIGVIVGSTYEFIHSSTDDSVWWTFVFLLSIPPNAFLNVWQAKYMILFTKDPEFEDHIIQRHLKDNSDSNLPSGEVLPEGSVGELCPEPSYQSVGKYGSGDFEPELVHKEVKYTAMSQGNDTFVKLWVLVGGTSVQFIQTVMLLPADALPGWGGSDSVSDAAKNLGNGIDAFFTYENNFIYGALYSFGFILTYIGAAYLNHYSATLCAMITELASPLTALLLVIVPSINLSGSETPLYYTLVAVVILVIATTLYTLWDYSTGAEKQQNEYEIKEELNKPIVVDRVCAEESSRDL